MMLWAEFGTGLVFDISGLEEVRDSWWKVFSPLAKGLLFCWHIFSLFIRNNDDKYPLKDITLNVIRPFLLSSPLCVLSQLRLKGFDNMRHYHSPAAWETQKKHTFQIFKDCKIVWVITLDVRPQVTGCVSSPWPRPPWSGQSCRSWWAHQNKVYLLLF